VSRESRLVTVLALNLGLLVALVIVGLTAHSLGVLAAGGDYLADSAAIALALVAVRMGRRAASREPGGQSVATAYAALVSAGVLLAVMVSVLVGSLLRLVHGTTKVDGLPVLIVSAVAAVTMIGGAVVLHADTDQVRHLGDEAVMRAITLDTVADAAAAGGVALAGAVILWTGRFYWLDPALAAIISTVVGVQAVVLLRGVVREIHANAAPIDGRKGQQ
jgi:cobalt-zinc-cadmium efflux system protein